MASALITFFSNPVDGLDPDWISRVKLYTEHVTSIEDLCLILTAIPEPLSQAKVFLGWRVAMHRRELDLRTAYNIAIDTLRYVKPEDKLAADVIEQSVPEYAYLIACIQEQSILPLCGRPSHSNPVHQGSNQAPQDSGSAQIARRYHCLSGRWPTPGYIPSYPSFLCIPVGSCNTAAIMMRSLQGTFL
jgi:hypothetical protein